MPATNPRRGRRTHASAIIIGTTVLLAFGVVRDASAAQTQAAAPAAASNTCDPNDLPTGSEGPDDDGDECAFTITGSASTPAPDQNANGEFATGNAATANCSKIAIGIATTVADDTFSLFYGINAPNGTAFLGHFLDNSGSPKDLPDGSDLSNKVKADPQFISMDKAVQAEAKKQLDAGKLAVTIDPQMLKRIKPTWPATVPTNDLEAAFGGTQGLDVNGNGYPQHGHYIGDINYTLRDIYGFYSTNKFLGAGKAMHYLQTCGKAHWFADSVTIKMHFDQPIG